MKGRTNEKRKNTSFVRVDSDYCHGFVGTVRARALSNAMPEYARGIGRHGKESPAPGVRGLFVQCLIGLPVSGLVSFNGQLFLRVHLSGHFIHEPFVEIDGQRNTDLPDDDTNETQHKCPDQVVHEGLPRHSVKENQEAVGIPK